MDRELERAVARARMASCSGWLSSPPILEHEHELLRERLGLGEEASLRRARLAFILAYRRPPLYALRELASRGDEGALRFWAYRLLRRARPSQREEEAARAIFGELSPSELHRLLWVGDPQEVAAAMVGADRDTTS